MYTIDKYCSLSLFCIKNKTSLEILSPPSELFYWKSDNIPFCSFKTLEYFWTWNTTNGPLQPKLVPKTWSSQCARDYCPGWMFGWLVRVAPRATRTQSREQRKRKLFVTSCLLHAKTEIRAIAVIRCWSLLRVCSCVVWKRTKQAWQLSPREQTWVVRYNQLKKIADLATDGSLPQKIYSAFTMEATSLENEW